jgi:transposase
VHSGVNPDAKVKHQLKFADYNEINSAVSRNKIILKRTPFFVRKHFFHAHPTAWKKYLIVHGHTPTQTLPRRLNNLQPKKKETTGTIVKHGFYYTHLPYFRKHPEKEKTVSIDVDTGAVTGNRLTAAGFSTENMKADKMLVDIVQVDVSKAYKGNEVLRIRKGEIFY